MHTVWELYNLITRRLLRWSALSVLLGIAAILFGGTYILDLPFVRGVGIQAIVWGLIDAGVAQGGQWLADRRRGDRRLTENDEPEARRLRRLLLINAALDVIYVGGGVILARTLGVDDPGWRGHGWGIVVQGVFLFCFDLLHAQNVPLAVPHNAGELYQGKAEHAAFAFPAVAGQGDAGAPATSASGRSVSAKAPAALLVHGYLGTPAEVRALGQAISGIGWEARGPLLPGFGTDIESLPTRRVEDWLAILDDELSALQAVHHPVLLVGYSMGGALALCLTLRRLADQSTSSGAPAPDGLVLLAPFTQAVPGPLESLWGVVRRLLPSVVRPLRWASLERPHIRHSMRGLMPDVDLDDPGVQRELRQMAVPIEILDGLLECNCTARRECRPLPLPTLVIQGDKDEVARPQYARRLAQCLGSGARYLEINANHALVYPTEPSWPHVERAVLEFAKEISRGSA
jgi:carboxylesterase